MARPTLRLTITAALALMTVATAVTITLLSYRSARRNLLDAYRVVLAQVAERISERTKGYLGPVKNAVAVTGGLVASGAAGPGRHDQLEQLFFFQLVEYHRCASFDFGDDAGNFVMVKRMADDSLATQSVLRSGGFGRASWKLRRPGAGLAEVAQQRSEKDDYDPRVRPWYTGAMRASGVQWTDVYALATDRKPAVSAAVAVDVPGAGRGVVSASITLEELDRFLATLHLGKQGYAFLVDRDGRLVGHPAGVRLREAADGSLVLPLASASGDAALQALAQAAPFRDALARGQSAPMFRFEVAGEPWLGSVVPIAYAVGGGWFAGALLPVADLLGPVRADLLRTVALSAAITAVAFLLSLSLGRGIARPLQSLAHEAARLSGFDFADRPFAASRFEEVHEIQRAFGGMKVGLRALEKYVPTKLVRFLLESGEEARLGAHSQEVTVFFSDIRGFSSFAEGLPPQELAERLGAYLGTLAEIVAEHHGTVDKYIGDAVMAFWNAPRAVDGHPLLAVSAALRCVARLRELDPEGRFHTRFGIHTTEAAVGNFGSADRLNYTVMGDGVNLASRLEGVNNVYATQVLITQETARRIESRIECRAIDRIAVKGRKQPTTLYEPLGEAGQVAPERLARARTYERALEAYFARRFGEASLLCAQVLVEDPRDGAASVLRARVDAFAKDPPPADWDGVWTLKEK